jgi:hypothetical protein
MSLIRRVLNSWHEWHLIKRMVRGFRGRGASESNWCAAEFHADAAGELDVLRVRWVCFPILLPETQGLSLRSGTLG